MAINSNHTAEDLNDVKCAIVEKNVSAPRAEFLKNILEFNKFTVVVAASAPPKAAKSAAPKTDAPIEETPQLEPVAQPTTFTVGVTDVRFNSVNAVFGRGLKSPNGNIVTLAYWNQIDIVPNDEIPYYE